MINASFTCVQIEDLSQSQLFWRGDYCAKCVPL